MRVLVIIALLVPASQAAADLQEQMQVMMADPNFQEYARQLAQPMEAMMEDAHQMQAAFSDPRVQRQMERVIEPITTLMADPEVQKEATRVAEQIQTVFADPSVQEDAKRMEEPLLAMLANPDPQNLEEQMQALMADPSLQELTNRIKEPINEMMSDDTFRDQVKATVKQVKAIMADPAFQKQARRISEPMIAMMDEAQQMQGMMQQMQERRSLASLLLATNPSLGRSVQVPMSSQRARTIMSDNIDTGSEEKTTSSVALKKMMPSLAAMTQAMMMVAPVLAAKDTAGTQSMPAPFLPGLITPLVTLLFPLISFLVFFVGVEKEE